MRNRVGLAPIVCALVALVALGGMALGAGRSQNVSSQAVKTGYSISTVTSWYRAAPSADIGSVVEDVNALINATGDIGSIESITTGGYPAVSVCATLQTASATMVVHFLRYGYDSTNARWFVRSRTTATLTADDLIQSDNGFLTQSTGFDTEGAPLCKVIIEAPSSGAVRGLWAEVY
jgi:hypothetical protein